MVIVGIDEVGRGCWAGPLVAGAVLLEKPIIGLKDSKKLSKAQREALALRIESEALAIGLGWVSASTIDSGGITAAVKMAMAEALAAIKAAYDEVIIDGAFNFLADTPKTRTLVRADDLVPAVSAASIIAKVARDNYMAEAGAKLPMYGFERHVGYGTAEHSAALKLHGVSELHRRSFKPIAALLH